jgi:hypothetical protein
VRKALKSWMVAVAMTAAVLAACGRQSKPANRAMNDDLKRDLDMAASSDLNLASQQKAASFPLTEVAQSSAPSPAKTLKKGSGPKATTSKHPTVKATPEPTIVANAEEPTLDVPTTTPSVTTEPAPDPMAPAVPRPSPVPVDPNGGQGARGQNGDGPNPGAGGGGGSILGGIFGVIIRGGVVDGDHCDPRSEGRGRVGRGNFPPGGVMSMPRVPMTVPTRRR